VLQGILNVTENEYKQMLKQMQREMPAFFERMLAW